MNSGINELNTKICRGGHRHHVPGAEIYKPKERSIKTMVSSSTPICVYRDKGYGQLCIVKAVHLLAKPFGPPMLGAKGLD